MELNQYISVIKESSLDQPLKDQLVQKFEQNGLTAENLQALNQVLEEHITQLNQKLEKLDRDLEARLSELDKGFMDDLNQEIDAAEQAESAAAADKLKRIEYDFNAENKKIGQILQEVETALSAEEAKSHTA